MANSFKVLNTIRQENYAKKCRRERPKSKPFSSKRTPGLTYAQLKKRGL